MVQKNIEKNKYLQKIYNNNIKLALVSSRAIFCWIETTSESPSCSRNRSCGQVDLASSYYYTLTEIWDTILW